MSIANTFVGLIGAGAPGGVSDGDDRWRLVIHFAARSCPEDGIIEREIRCEMPVSHDDLKRYMAALRPYQVIQVEVLDDSNPDCVILDAISAMDAKSIELAALAARLQVPVIVSDQELGDLTLDRQFGSYSGRVSWKGREVNLDLECASPEEPDSAIAQARKLLSAQDQWQQRIGDRAVNDLLELKNDSWLDDGETEIARSDFLARMSLETICISADGDFSFWFDDGDLFWGHAIVVAGNLDTGPDRADIAG